MSEKKRPSLKIILVSVFSVFLLLSAGAIYYASTQISNEEIRKILIVQLEKSFPQAQVELGQLNISAGFNFLVKMESLKISLDQKGIKSTLLSLNDAVVSIPVWAILTGGGEVDVSINKPEIEYVVAGKDSNWSLAMSGSSQAGEAKSQQETQGEASSGAPSSAVYSLPLFVTESSLNLRIQDILLAYKTKEMSGDVTLSKFLVKNFNFETPTAFEVDSVLSFKMKEDQMNFSTLVIGEINFAKFIQDQVLPMKAMIRTSKISVPGLAPGLGEMKTELDLTLVQSGDVSGTVKNNWDGILADFQMSMAQGALKISEIKFESSPDQLLRLIDMKIPELNSGKSLLKLGGQVNLSKDGKIIPQLDFSLSPALSYTSGQISAQVSANGKYEKTDLEVNVQTDLFSGVVTTKVTGKHDLNQPFSMEKLGPFQTSIIANNLKVSEKFIQETIYPAQAPAQKPSVEAPAEPQTAKPSTAPAVLPPGRIDLALNSIYLADKELNAKGVFLLKADSLATQSFTFNYVEGQGKLTHLTELKKNEMTHQFDFSLRDFDLSGINPFLPKFIGGTKGIFNTSVKGSATSAAYDMIINVEAKKGELLAMDISDQLNQMIKSVPILKDKVGDDKSFDFDGKFESLSFKAKATEKKAEFSSLKFVGINNKIDITGQGYLFLPPLTEKSEVLLNLKDRSGKVAKILQENVGDSLLPIQLAGPGLDLKPQYEYTASKLAKTAFENRGRKEVERAKAKVIKKVEEELGDKLKDELKQKASDKLKQLLGR